MSSSSVAQEFITIAARMGPRGQMALAQQQLQQQESEQLQQSEFRIHGHDTSYDITFTSSLTLPVVCWVTVHSAASHCSLSCSHDDVNFGPGPRQRVIQKDAASRCAANSSTHGPCPTQCECAWEVETLLPGRQLSDYDGQESHEH